MGDCNPETRRELTAQLKQVKRDLDQSKKETSEFRTQCSQIKDNIKWTQPTGTVDVKTCTYKYGLEKIILIFTFPDGTQTTHHSSPGSKIKGGPFDGYFSRDCEGEMLCRMLKAAFRRGMMFNLGKTGTVILNGVTLYTGSVYDSEKLRPTYVKYIKTLKKELRAKRITEANIDQTGTLEEAFTVDGC
ncbi:uncharacterized protein LOC128245721 [Mya arenaria]|uniref:uncharacterized protein LOC128245721 n=1 Tax=Mya arenaria TaxID=6604 RepID=UPI0022E35DE9|nr:uncharacterized protein LOC128245721 [Mya arenaria]XP_052819909.1 uncharacterized protein LOC128245721 [Mya arenaria]